MLSDFADYRACNFTAITTSNVTTFITNIIIMKQVDWEFWFVASIVWLVSSLLALDIYRDTGMTIVTIVALINFVASLYVGCTSKE